MPEKQRFCATMEYRDTRGVRLDFYGQGQLHHPWRYTIYMSKLIVAVIDSAE